MAEKKVTRLKFTKNELTDEKVRRAAAKAERAAARAEEAQSKLPKRTKLRIIREAAGEPFSGSKLHTEDHAAKTASSKLRIEKEVVSDSKPGVLARTGRTAARTVIAGALAETKKAVDDADDGNAGTEALSTGKSAAETGGYAVSGSAYSHKLKTYEKAEHLVEKSDKANVDALYQKATQENPDAPSNPLSRWKQKQEIKKEYAAAKRAGNAAASGSSSAAKSASDAAKETKSFTEKAIEYVKEHPKGILIILALGFLVVFISSTISSCSVMMGGGGQVVLGTSYTAEIEDLKAVDEDYTALELELQQTIDNIESDHPGYDEYRYNLAQIGHDPYELASLLTVQFENYTREEVQTELQRIFNAQYKLTLREEVQIRTTTDSEGNEEEYEYYILHVTLTNSSIDTVARNSGLSDDQLERYDVLQETRGNRDDIFAGTAFAVPGEYMDYDIPGEALTDERFRNMITEAEKYLGYPYVWGGSSPSTSFDCSGFVSWVINHCGNGWNVGRLTASGLMSVCDIIPASEAKPGDLIFFQGTYNTTGASHVGIYVGNSKMIHCGNPISYADISSSYWQEHFYCYGRIRD